MPRRHLQLAASTLGMLLAAVMFATVSGCERTPVDPEAMAAEVGKRAFEFYRLLNEGMVYQAGLFLSAQRRGSFADPLDEPLIRERIGGVYDRILAGEVEVDYKRRNVATVRVTRYRRIQRPDTATTLIPLDSGVHRWVRESGSWFYDGPAASP